MNTNTRIIHGDALEVMDPFAGSGSTALACRQLGLSCICVEKDTRYHAAAVQRLNSSIVNRKS